MVKQSILGNDWQKNPSLTQVLKVCSSFAHVFWNWNGTMMHHVTKKNKQKQTTMN